MTLVFATHNTHKLNEIINLAPQGFKIVSLNEIGCTQEIEEYGTTLEENAKIKASYILNHYNFACFADDTGLIVPSLNGAPGVLSARYAGNEKNSEKNIEKLLEELSEKKDRSAYFKTIICYVSKETTHYFEGVVNGKIISGKRGNGGFGYDPIFKPDGYEQTFAELPLTIKNEIGHRGLAMKKFLDFLKSSPIST